jgi:hypothetical protein
VREIRPDSVLYALVEYTADRAVAARWIELRRAAAVEPSSDDALRRTFEAGPLEASLRADLAARLQAGELVATGIWSGGKSRELVPKDWWAGAGWSGPNAFRKLDIDGDFARNFGGEVHQLQIYRSNDPRLKNTANVRSGEPDRDKGGPDPRYDRGEVAREIANYTGTDKPKTKRSLRRHLRNWADRKFKSQPDGRTVTAWIKRYCPDWPSK